MGWSVMHAFFFFLAAGIVGIFVVLAYLFVITIPSLPLTSFWPGPDTKDTTFVNTKTMHEKH